MKSFLNRLGLLFHSIFYINFLINLILGIVFLLDDEVFLILLAPISLLLGWVLRWLFTGEVANIIPFIEVHKKVFRFPKVIFQSISNTNELYLPLIASILVGVFFVYEQHSRDIKSWQIDTYGTTCDKAIGTYSNTGEDFFCHDLKKICKGEDNSKSSVCKNYEERDSKPEPNYYILFSSFIALPFTIFIHFIIRSIIFFYLSKQPKTKP